METRKKSRRSGNSPAKGKSNRATNNSRSGHAGTRSGGSHRGSKKRKKNLPYQQIAIVGVFLILVITCVVWGAKAAGKKSETDESQTEETTAMIVETELQNEVMVDGVHITGMSREEAREAIMKQHSWNMKVMIDGTEHSVTNLIGEKLNLLLDEIFAGEAKESYSLDTSGLEDYVTAEVERLAKEYDVPAENGALIGFDKDNGSFLYSPEVKGKGIDKEQLQTDMNAVIQAKDFDAVLTARVNATQPELTMAQAKELYKVIGTFTTKTTSNKDRNTNIRLAAEALDGLIIKPGEDFSFNKTTGNRTEQRGYRPAGAYVNGVLVEEPGGGVCQVSSTLYNAVVFSGLKTTERHAHSFEPSYVTPGEDAMVSYDGYAGPDMRFTNNSKDTVAIRAKFADQTLTISIVGIPILESGVQVKMKSKKIADIDPPAPVYEEDQSLEPDVEKVVKQPTLGSRWETQLITLKDGQVVKEELLHKSTYKGKPATIKRNTSGTVVPVETEPVETSESISETESTEETDMTEAPEESTSQVQPEGPGMTQPQPTQPSPTEPQTTAPQGPGSSTDGPNGPTAPTVPAVPTQPETTGNMISPSPINPSTGVVSP